MQQVGKPESGGGGGNTFSVCAVTQQAGRAKASVVVNRRLWIKGQLKSKTGCVCICYGMWGKKIEQLGWKQQSSTSIRQSFERGIKPKRKKRKPEGGRRHWVLTITCSCGSKVLRRRSGQVTKAFLFLLVSILCLQTSDFRATRGRHRRLNAQNRERTSGPRVAEIKSRPGRCDCSRLIN